MSLGKRGDCGSTSPRSLDELAQLRTHTAYYSPVMIAPLSIDSSHADCRPERSFLIERTIAAASMERCSQPGTARHPPQSQNWRGVARPAPVGSHPLLVQ
jgi:hypothetical protein